ncbi:hypothetical protein HBI23_168920 [Parastagonospora nodorum]|nr:hypothetical protein HBI23_168920 [Parastagonospora nodorum]
MAERTGSLVFNALWSYVKGECMGMPNNRRWQNAKSNALYHRKTNRLVLRGDRLIKVQK